MRFFVLHSLPFGARNSFFVFAQFGKAFEHILASLLWITTSEYVDDYPEVAPAAAVDVTQGIAEEFFMLIGWEVKTVEKEAGPLGGEADARANVAAVPMGYPEFAALFRVLGVKVDFSDPVGSQMCVGNTEGRIVKTSDLIDQVRSSGVVSPPLLRSLRGVLGFARGQSFGRCGAASLSVISRMAVGGAREVTEEDLEALLFWTEFLASAPPRTILFNDPTPPILIWTDGAEEDAGVSVAGVVWDRASGLKEFFGGPVEDDVVVRWQERSAKTRVIHQAELLPCAVAVVLWGSRMRNRRILVFIDNDAARAALVAGGSGNKASEDIAARFWKEATRWCLFPWFERVPSPSNIADGSSRDDSQLLLKLGFVRVPFDTLSGCAGREGG